MRRFLILFALMVGAMAQKKDYTGHRLISMNVTSRDQLDLLAELEESLDYEELDFWAGPSMADSTTIRVSPNDYRKLQKVLKEGGLQFTVLQENIQELLDVEAMAQAKSSKTTGCDHPNQYCSFSQIQNFLEDIESRFPDNVKISNIGESFEKRHLYQVKIAKNLNEPKSAVWIEAGTHAREWISVASGIELIERLAENKQGDFTNIMLDKYDWYIIPVHNPDGYAYSFTKDRMWRKNRQPSTCSGWSNGIGIDLNRNWDADYGNAGTSTSCRSDVYRGKYAFEAPETAALRDAVANTPDVVAFFSIHAYSQFMLVPYGYTSAKPAQYSQLMAVANEMMAALKTVDGTDFISGTPPDLLSAASGGAYDYFYIRGVQYSYTYELRPASGSSNGFVLDPMFIPLATEEVIVSLSAFANMNLQ